MTATATYTFFVDWNNDDSFNDAYEEVTADVLSATWERGFNGPPPAQAGAGQLTLRLRNGTGKYTCENESSVIVAAYGALRPGLRVRALMDGVVQFEGRIDSINTSSPEILAAGEAELVALDGLAQFTEAEADIDVALQEDVSTGGAIVALLTAEGVTDLDLIDSGQSSIDAWWARNRSTRLDLIRELQDNELGRFFVSKDGRYEFHDRHHVFGHVVRATYGDESGSLRMWQPVLENPWPYVYNSVRAEVRTFDLTEPDTLLVTLTYNDGETARGGRPIKLPDGETTTIYLELTDETAAGDYLAVKSWSTAGEYAAAEIKINTDENADKETGEWIQNDPNITITATPYATRQKVDITNNYGADAWVCIAQGYGQAIIEIEPVKIRADDAASQAIYKRREYPNPSLWITDQTDGQALIDYIVTEMKDPRTRIRFQIVANVDEAHLQEASDIDIDDRIHITDSTTFGLYVDDNFIVDHIAHSVQPEIEGGFHIVTVTCTKAPVTELGALATGYTSKIGEDVGPPDDLYINGADPGGKIVIGVVARKHNSDVFEGEIRAKFYSSNFPEYADLRTVAEGGTLVDNLAGGEVIASGLYADHNGVNYQFTSLGQGRWYFAGRLKNKSYGWSVWTDGNSRPTRVTDWVDTESSMNAETGPASADSTVTLHLVNNGNQAVVKFTRPSNSCTTIFWAVCQLMNANAGNWYDLNDEESGVSPAQIFYDGSGTDHTFNKTTCTITSGTSPEPWAALTRGLILFDVFNCTDGHTFNIDDCQWGWFDNNGVAIGNVPISGAQFRPYPDPDNGQTWEHIRIQIVEAPWNWNTYGYWGGTALGELDFINAPGSKGDKTTESFVFPSITIPAELTMANLQARVWVENKVCRTEVGTSDGITEESGDGSPSGAHDLEILTHNEDADIPTGMMAFRWHRESNYLGIYCVAFWSSSALPAQGPFSEERTAVPSSVLESGLSCDIVAGSYTVTITGRSDQSREGMVLVYELAEDSDEYEDLDGDYISADDGETLTLGQGWGARWTGNFTGYIIKPWYDVPANSSNLKYYQFKVPDEIGGDASAEVWQSTPVPMPSGHFYVTGCSRNPYGLGNRITADSDDIGTGSGALCVVLDDAAEVIPNANLVGKYNEKLLVWSVDGNRTLGNAINAKCGQLLRFRIINTSESEIAITLGSKYRRGQAFPELAQESGVPGDLYIVEGE